MKKYLFLILMLISAGLFSACGDDKDDTLEVDEDWKAASEAKFTEISNDPSYSHLSMKDYNGFICYKVLESGDGDERPLYTSKVSVYYEGSTHDGEVFDSVVRGYDPIVDFTLNSTTSPLILGWLIALQHMVVGDKWEVWIPYQLGYGATGTSAILPYSTLRFVIELVKIENPS